MPDESDITEEKRQMVLDTLSFFVQERNRALFQLSTVKIRRREIEKNEEEIRNKARKLKSRLLFEIDKYMDILKPSDRQQLLGEDDENSEI